MAFTKDKFMSFYKGSSAASDCFDNVSKALADMKIMTENTLIGALATVRTEVGKNFLPIREMATGKEYEGRRDLGNTAPGDGVKYKGRGYIQLTGKTNYKIYGDKLGIDLVKNPDLALDPIIAARILALYFYTTKANVACDTKNWVKVRERVNGGTNGLDTFLSVIKQYIS